jgi:hypothetical protein
MRRQEDEVAVVRTPSIRHEFWPFWEGTRARDAESGSRPIATPTPPGARIAAVNRVDGRRRLARDRAVFGRDAGLVAELREPERGVVEGASVGAKPRRACGDGCGIG